MYTPWPRVVRKLILVEEVGPMSRMRNPDSLLRCLSKGVDHPLE